VPVAAAGKVGLKASEKFFQKAGQWIASWFKIGKSRKAVDAPRGAGKALKHDYKYHPRIRYRGVQDPKAHNFPYSFDDMILKTKPIKQPDGSLLYRKKGTLNGKEGYFEIAVNPENGTIFHRTFRRKR